MKIKRDLVQIPPLRSSGVTTAVGCVLVLTSCLLSFVLVPSLVDNIIISQVVLEDDTIQLERFEQVPFSLDFIVTVWEISNPDQVLNGEVPVMRETGPYVYKLYQSRNISYMDGDIIRYRRMERFEFDAEASFPYTEDDMVTITNVPYHAIAQIAEQSFPNLLAVLNLALSSVFGQYNSPIITVRVGDLLIDGVSICVNPGIVGAVACSIIREIGQSAQNLAQQEDGSLKFSIIAYKNGIPSSEYEVRRGLENSDQLGEILYLDGAPHFLYWVDDDEGNPGVCNQINGTDSGIFAPFVDREKSLYAINTDICRSVELRYQQDVEVDGIPALKYSANEWLLNNEEGCFCINVTTGINRDNGCLLDGGIELYTCLGAMLVLSYPHFLYADLRYRNGVLGMAPIEDLHRIFVEIEPNTGYPVRGAKKAQFNIFQRPVSSISSTASLRTTLTPIVWVEESFEMPDEYKDEIRDRLLASLRILDIVIPIFISVCCLVLLLGIAFLIRARKVAQSNPPVLESQNKT